MTTITHKHENGYGIRRSKKACNDLADYITRFFDLNVTFYGRYEYDATGKSYVSIAERNELHVFDTQTDAYHFISNLDYELTEAELATAC